jgi:RES domain-containing protein
LSYGPIAAAVGPATVLDTTIPASVRSRLFQRRLPASWWRSAAELQRIGGEWLERGETAVLKVPSAIVIEEWNYLLNPLHADFGKLRLSAPKIFSFDRRVARRGRSRRLS